MEDPKYEKLPHDPPHGTAWGQTVHVKPLPFLSLNPTLVSKISGPPDPCPNHPGDPTHIEVAHSQSNDQAATKSANQKEYDEGVNPNHMIDPDQSTSLSAEDKSLWYEYGCV